MANVKFLDTLDLAYSTLNDNVRTWIRSTYNKSNTLLDASSPFGQVIDTMEMFYTYFNLILKNSVQQTDITKSNNANFIRNIAKIAGHNSSRAICAKGTLLLKTKAGVDITSVFGGYVVFQQDTIIRNKTNNLEYTISLPSTQNKFNILNGSKIFLPIKQGSYTTQYFTGDGTQNQSYQVNVNNIANIDNFDYYILYNGINLNIKVSFYDMLPDEYAVVVNTGSNGGIDVKFGNGEFGFIPDIGSQIDVKYLSNAGIDGNILNNRLNDFTFIDQIKDGADNIVSIETIFDIYINTDINMASDGESVDLTKQLIPYVSKNFVLSTPDQFIYNLTKLNMFSKINAFNVLDDNDTFKIRNDMQKMIDSITANININENDKSYYSAKLNEWKNLSLSNDNIIYLFLIPKITQYFTKDINYFNIPLPSFYLDAAEKQKVSDYLQMMGTMQLTTTMNILDPIITKYAMNIYLNIFDNVIEDNVRIDIIDAVSTFMINNQRFDKIVKADLITDIKGVNGVDSVDLTFISEVNERYHRENKNLPSYNPNAKLGLDPILGDIISTNNQLPILRGGWFDRHNIFYNEVIQPTGMSSINIIFLNVIQKNLNN